MIKPRLQTMNKTTILTTFTLSGSATVEFKGRTYQLTAISAKYRQNIGRISAKLPKMMGMIF